MAGAALAFWIDLRTRKPRKYVNAFARRATIAAAGSVALLALMLYWQRPVVGREIRDFVAFAAFGPPLIGVAVAGWLAFVIDGSGGGALMSRLLRLRPLVFIGRRSYMIYLVHVPCYFVVSRLTGQGFAPGDTRLAPAILSTCLSLAFAAASWKMLEAPLLRVKDRI